MQFGSNMGVWGQTKPSNFGGAMNQTQQGSNLFGGGNQNQSSPFQTANSNTGSFLSGNKGFAGLASSTPNAGTQTNATGGFAGLASNPPMFGTQNSTSTGTGFGGFGANKFGSTSTPSSNTAFGSVNNSSNPFISKATSGAQPNSNVKPIPPPPDAYFRSQPDINSLPPLGSQNIQTNSTNTAAAPQQGGEATKQSVTPQIPSKPPTEPPTFGQGIFNSNTSKSGQNAVSNTTTTSTGSKFGQSTVSNANTSSTGSSFGQGTTSNTNTTSPGSSFGQGSTSNTNTTFPGSSFGQGSTSNTNTTFPGSSFGQGSTSNTNTTFPGSMFGKSTTSNATSPFATSNTNTTSTLPKPEPATASSPPKFGQPAQPATAPSSAPPTVNEPSLFSFPQKDSAGTTDASKKPTDKSTSSIGQPMFSSSAFSKPTEQPAKKEEKPPVTKPKNDEPKQKYKKTVNTYGLPTTFVIKFYEMMYRMNPELKWNEIDKELKELAATIVQ